MSKYAEYSPINEVPFGKDTAGDSEQWKRAMAEEIKAILRSNTWKLVDRPRDQHVIGSRMVFRNKYKADGNMDKRKARLVAQGFSRKPGIHFNTIKTAVALANEVNPADRETSEELRRKAEAMLRDFGDGNKVCLLHKALYGSRQAGRSWYNELIKVL